MYTKLIIGLFCVIIFIIKMQIHRYLDKKNNYTEKFFFVNGVNPIFLLPYYNPVNNTYKKTKTMCNITWILFIILFITTICAKN